MLLYVSAQRASTLRGWNETPMGYFKVVLLVVKSSPMKTLDLAGIEGKIITRLRERGPATVSTLASDLRSAQFDVQSALNGLMDKQLVRALFGGLWDVHWTPPTS